MIDLRLSCQPDQESHPRLLCFDRSDTTYKLGRQNSHKRIIDGNNKDITSALQLLVIDEAWDVAV